MENIINEINTKQINKIFANKTQKTNYLSLYYDINQIKEIIPNKISDIDNAIIKTWNYEKSNKIIRKMFFETEKYKIGKSSQYLIKKMINEWQNLNLGEFKWPFQPRAFDQYIQNINTNITLSEKEKDEKVIFDIVKFRRIKKINTARNDFIEYLIVENNENVTPTLKHNRGIDFYINGFPYDQKVSKSVTLGFIRDYKENWKDIAKAHPELVAKYLYEYQDEARFGAESRLLVVYLDEDLTNNDIYKCVTTADMKKPITISFEYNHSNNIKVNYTVDCFIILLHK